MGIQESRIYFGVKADDMSEDAKKQKSVSSGIYINEVLADSPAFKAGLRDGDIILSIDDQTVLSTSNFYNIISAYKPGDKITVSTKRISGNTEKEIEVEVVLTEKAQ
jgi:S1-C subfamily serine protease